MRAFPGFLRDLDPRIYLSDNYAVLDFETEVNDGRYGSAIDKRNHLAFSSLWHSNSGWRNCWGSEFEQSHLQELIRGVDFIVGHNLKYEYGWLRRIGIDTGGILGFDTQIAEYVLLGNLVAGDSDSGVPPTRISLDACCRRRGYGSKDPIVDIWMDHGIKVSQMPKKWVEARCIRDVDTTRRLFLDQRSVLARTNRLAALYTRCLLTPILSRIEAEGCHLDSDRVYETCKKYADEYRALSDKFNDFTGGINWRSSKQVAAYLYDTLAFDELRGRDGQPKRTKTGKRKTDTKVLDKLRATTEEQREFIRKKKEISIVGSAISKNLDYFEEICTNHDGTFFAEFNQTITATHRLSSTGIKVETAAERDKSCQLTNIPRVFKCLFRARNTGWLIGECDGAQIEFRVAAHLGRDRQAYTDIRDPNFDAHCVTAAAMYEKEYNQLLAQYRGGDKTAASLRQVAKSETFKPLYGGSKGTPAQERWYAAFKRRYPDLAKTQEDWVYEALSTKQLVTPWGLIYYWPHIRMSSSGFVNNGSAIYNYPIQALATAEIIPIAITHFWHRVRVEGLDEYIIPVNTVHDSLVCEIHPDYADSFRRIAQQSFGPDVFNYLKKVYGMEFSTALGVGIKIGAHWSEGKEEVYECIDGLTMERRK